VSTHLHPYPKSGTCIFREELRVADEGKERHVLRMEGVIFRSTLILVIASLMLLSARNWLVNGHRCSFVSKGLVVRIVEVAFCDQMARVPIVTTYR
jgi:hypothetical protein